MSRKIPVRSSVTEEVFEKLKDEAKQESRSRSSLISTILTKHYDLHDVSEGEKRHAHKA